MTSFKRIMALLMCVIMVLCLCSCSAKDKIIESISDFKSNDEIESGVDNIGFNIAYVRTDSLNPYKAKEQINKAVSTLLFDSLFTVDKNFKPVVQMASTFSVSDNKITVVLKSSLKFTDSSAVTGEDVVYSFNLAKDSDAYKVYLENITDASAEGNSISFTTGQDAGAEVANLVFPVIKNGSDKTEEETEEAVAVTPIGSGRYAVKEENNNKYLAYNKSRLGSYHPKYNKIGLTDVSTAGSVQNSIQSLFSLGSVDFYTNDYGTGEFTNYTGTGTTYDMTNLVYIGVNSDSTVLSDGRVRRAIAMIISRNDLTSVSFAGYAVATSTPFHPGFSELEGCTLPALKDDAQAGKALLDEAGYISAGSDSVRYNEKTHRSMNITLLVNKENSFKVSMARSIQQSLANANISVRLKEYSYSNYVEAVEEGSYDLYIGEAKLSNSFDLSRFFKDGGALGYGINSESQTAEMYLKYRNGEATMQNFLDKFADELPIIPVAYRQGLTIKSSRIKTNIITSSTDCFYNIDEWTIE